MKGTARFLVPVGILAVLVGFFVIGLQKDPGEIRSPLIGRCTNEKPPVISRMESWTDRFG